MTTQEIMEQAQVFASAWSLVVSRFDQGDELANAEAMKLELREMVEAQAQEIAEYALANEDIHKWRNNYRGEISNLLIQRDELLEALVFAKEKISELHVELSDDDFHYPIINDAVDMAQR